MSAAKKILFFSALVLFSISCNNKPESSGEETTANGRKFPPVKVLDSIPETNFVLTMEHPISENRNAVYAVSFLYGWNTLKDLVGYPVARHDANDKDFKLLNESMSYQNVLNKSEYDVDVAFKRELLEITAYFKKSLSFAEKFQKAVKPVLFNGTAVQAFGLFSYDVEVGKEIEILYYENDSRFIVKLQPKDAEQEIILAKGIAMDKTFAATLEEIAQLKKDRYQEKTDSEKIWKYNFNYGDTLAVPVLNFNIEANYKNLEGKSFLAEGGLYQVKKAYQRTALILDELGAEVESMAELAVDSAAPMTRPELPKPKKFIFDGPFLVLLKRKDSKNPYFAAKIVNEELMNVIK